MNASEMQKLADEIRRMSGPVRPIYKPLSRRHVEMLVAGGAVWRGTDGQSLRFVRFAGEAFAPRLRRFLAQHFFSR